MKFRIRIQAIVLCALLLLPALALAELRPQGSVNLLEGRTLLISVYLEEEGALWQPKDIAHTRKALGIATAYIAEQAAACGHAAELLCDADDLRYTIQYEGAYRESRAESSDFNATVMELIRKEVPLDDLLARYQTDSYGFICLLSNTGSSYALPYYSSYGDDDYDELCVVYLYDSYSSASVYESVPTYAHELLHLFGAVDLYTPFAEDGVTNAVVRYVEQTAPDELMFTTYESDGSASDTSISQTLSDITLYSVGLIDEPDVLAQFPSLRRENVAAFSDQTGLLGDESADPWSSLWDELLNGSAAPWSSLWDGLPASEGTPDEPLPGSLLVSMGLGSMRE